MSHLYKLQIGLETIIKMRQGIKPKQVSPKSDPLVTAVERRKKYTYSLKQKHMSLMICVLLSLNVQQHRISYG